MTRGGQLWGKYSYREFLDLFEDNEGSQLPPHRQGVDMEIKLEHDEQGKEKEVTVELTI